MSRADWMRLAPGVYDDRAGGLHLVVSELLYAHGYADTPENRETLIEAARQIWEEQMHQAVEVEDE